MTDEKVKVLFEKGNYHFTVEDVFNEISNSIRNKTIIHTKEKVKELINIQWIFFILLSLLCFEWFIRKYNGLN